MSLVGACSAEQFMFSPDVSISRQQKANEMNLLEANAVVVGFALLCQPCCLRAASPLTLLELIYNLSLSDHVLRCSIPDSSVGKESTCNAEAGFDPLVGQIPWRREWLPTPVFWPGELHGLYGLWGGKESDTTKQLSLSRKFKSWRKGRSPEKRINFLFPKLT